jgi:GMP synthase (glutamine-hydrolysing)
MSLQALSGNTGTRYTYFYISSIPGLTSWMKDLVPQRHNSHVDRLFDGLQGGAMQVWMSHGDKLSQLPSDFCTIATTNNSPYASIAHNTRPIFGIQFHPEVTHSLRGTEILKNFAVGICGAKQTWNMSNFINQEITRVRKLVGEKGQVIGAVSGGVDSTVAAKLSKSPVVHSSQDLLTMI